MKLIRPLQLSFNGRVLEQNRKFYFIASATLGVNLRTGEELLDFDFFKDAMACMGDSALPDMGMPKPNGEVLLTGKCFAPGGKAVRAHEVGLRVGQLNKNLYVFGDRFWKRAGGLVKVITDPEPFTEMDISYPNAFGGEGYDKNPQGKGLPIKSETGETIQPLPNIEDPNNLIGATNDTPDPASFDPLDPIRPQRMRFQGTYDDTYLHKYYPGYPEDHDWRHFLCAPPDQWIKDYFQGNESFAISNMHPEVPVIEGDLPGLYARCFIMHTIKNAEPEFEELSLNLDTVWFLPEKMLALLIWRKGIEVGDDEGEQISHVLAAYEDRTQEPRTVEHYRQALEKRMDKDDGLLNTFNTSDLIPVGHKCAMELLMDKASSGSEESELGKNIDAKVESIKKQVDEKIEEATSRVEKEMADMPDGDIPVEGMKAVPDEAKEYMPGASKADLKKLIKEHSDPKPDPEVQAFKQKLEEILPGITMGDSKKIDFKDFSFDKVDQIMDVVVGFCDKKEKDAKDQATKEIEKVKKQIKEQLDQIDQGLEEMPEEMRKDMPKEPREKLEQTLEKLDEVDLEESPPGPLPRMDAEEMIGKVSQVSPQLMEAMEHVKSSKAIGDEQFPDYEMEGGEAIDDLEKKLEETLEANTKEAEKALREAEEAFKEVYIMAAHFMKDGLSPHKDPVEDVAQRLLKDISRGKDVSNGDWACIDLSGQNLDGVDLSGAFLEQVNFTGASLKGANLSGAIMARANLTDADLSGTNLTEANVGQVNASRANFTDSNLKSARLSKGDFTDADFTRAELEDVESLEIIVNGANFAEAHMPGTMFIESELTGAKFPKADMSSSVFLKCDIKDADFSGAGMTRCTFADVRLANVLFDGADLTNACFAATDPEKAGMKDVRFRGACLKEANFQDVEMQGTDLSSADLENSNFGGADLTDAVLSRAHAKSAQFRKARLFGANLNGINLMQGSLAKAYLVNASFVGANLYSVDFLRSTITNTDFRGSNLELTLIENWRPE